MFDAWHDTSGDHDTDCGWRTDIVYNIADYIHPNAMGAQYWADKMWNESMNRWKNNTFQSSITPTISDEYYFRCYADDNRRSLVSDMGSINFTYTAPTVPSEEEIVASPGSSYVPTPTIWTGTTYVTTEEQFDEGFTKLVAEKERFKIIVDNIGVKETHHVGVKEIANDSVLIIIESDPVEVRLKVGEDAKVDVTNDSYYDVYVILNAIVDGKADITVKEMYEMIPESVEGSVETNGEIVEQESPMGSVPGEIKITWLLFWTIILAILVILIVLAIRELRK